jgi:hypothetical protein
MGCLPQRDVGRTTNVTSAGMPSDTLTIDKATAKTLATTLHLNASSVRQILSRQLVSQLSEPGGASRSLDKSGEEIQREAMESV